MYADPTRFKNASQIQAVVPTPASREGESTLHLTVLHGLKTANKFQMVSQATYLKTS